MAIIKNFIGRSIRKAPVTKQFSGKKVRTLPKKRTIGTPATGTLSPRTPITRAKPTMRPAPAPKVMSKVNLAMRSLRRH